jgi:putative peptidoglycan lipid II flippase
VSRKEQVGSTKVAAPTGLSPLEAPKVAIASSSRRLARPRTMLGLAGLYASSRALGLVREIGIAFFFGTSAAADRLSAAFVVASLASIVGGEALYAGSVRWLGAARPEPQTVTGSGARYAELVAVGRKAAVAATAVFALLGPVATLAVLGRRTNTAETIALSVALAPSVGASLLSACVNARLTLERRFALLNGVQILYSAGAVVGLAVIASLGRDVGPLPVALGWSAGNVAAAVVLYVRARPASSREGSQSASALEMLWIGLPIATAYALVAVQGLTDRAVAARLGSGKVAALSYADRLFLLPVGFVIATLGPMVLGALVVEQQRERQVQTVALEQLRTLVAYLIPLSLGFVAIAPQLVSLVFESGHFGQHSRELTVAALDGFSVGIAAVAVSLVLVRMMQAVTKLREIVFVSVVAVVLNAVLSVGGGLWLGLYGVTLSTSLVALAVVHLQTIRIARELGRRWARQVFRSAILPVTSCCALSIAAVSADRHDVLTETGRTSVLLGIAILVGTVVAAKRGWTHER